MRACLFLFEGRVISCSGKESLVEIEGYGDGELDLATMDLRGCGSGVCAMDEAEWKGIREGSL